MPDQKEEEEAEAEEEEEEESNRIRKSQAQRMAPCLGVGFRVGGREWEFPLRDPPRPTPASAPPPTETRTCEDENPGLSEKERKAGCFLRKRAVSRLYMSWLV